MATRLTSMAMAVLLVAGMSLGHAEEWQDDTRNSKGLWRDTRYFLAYQVGAIGVLYAMPESVTGWTDEQKSGYSMSVWWDNVTHPDWDSDDHLINYVAHPYWGAAYYVRARERGYDWRTAFWYSVLLSSTYEFGAEALFEEPSLQDLIVTPVLGSLLGEYFVRVRDDIHDNIAARGHRTAKERWVLVLTDPLGGLNRRVRKMMGRDTDLSLYPYYYSLQNDPVVGLQFRLAW